MNVFFEELAGRVMKAKLEGHDYVTLCHGDVHKVYHILGWDQRFMSRCMDVTLSDIERWCKSLPDQAGKA